MSFLCCSFSLGLSSLLPSLGHSSPHPFFPPVQLTFTLLSSLLPPYTLPYLLVPSPICSSWFPSTGLRVCAHLLFLTLLLSLHVSPLPAASLSLSVLISPLILSLPFLENQVSLCSCCIILCKGTVRVGRDVEISSGLVVLACSLAAFP